jgi:hypothetical protein
MLRRTGRTGMSERVQLIQPPGEELAEEGAPGEPAVLALHHREEGGDAAQDVPREARLYKAARSHGRPQSSSARSSRSACTWRDTTRRHPSQPHSQRLTSDPCCKHSGPWQWFAFFPAF